MKSSNFLDFTVFGTRVSFVKNFHAKYGRDRVIENLGGGVKILHCGKFRIVWGK